MKKQKKRFPKCKQWPRCHCIVQGYINPRETNDCGRKPPRPPRPIIVRERVGWEP
jgi:hypothetical protein